MLFWSDVGECIAMNNLKNLKHKYHLISSPDARCDDGNTILSTFKCTVTSWMVCKPFVRLVFFPYFNPNDIIVFDSIGKQMKREYMMYCECVCFREVVEWREEIRANEWGAKRTNRTHCILAFCDLHVSPLNTTASKWLCKRTVIWLQLASDTEIYDCDCGMMEWQSEKGETQRTEYEVDSTNANWFNKCTQT